MDSFVITYDTGMMIVTHPSGVVSEYAVFELYEFKSYLDAEQNSLDLQQEDIDTYIAACQGSMNSR